MVGKFLFFIFAATATFLGISAGAVTTSQNVDIIVTHGASTAPTFTFVNNSGKTLTAGSPVSFGQGFRYGDIMPGTYPLIRLASTHAALAGQQWDEISTWTENGGNGSWRHAVWTAWLPADLAAGATTQFEFIPTAGTYSQTSHQPLSALCAGPAAHDLKIHLTDVRNQDDSVRDSGDATFRVCDNIANNGRDAPRHLRAGNVYDEYVVLGMFVYATSGHKDPLLYAQCNIDIFTQSSDGVSPGDVRWVCHIHNSWLNVSAGSTGNAGNPGPAGFANDPQAISYRPEVDDGATDVLDWSGLDATISSGSNPVSSPGGPNCNPRYWGQTLCMFVPSSTGTNSWYLNQAARVTCSGGCIGGLADNSMYFMWPVSSAGTGGSETRYVHVLSDVVLFTNALSGSQGTGSTTFSMRAFHKHWLTWQTLDATGLENWSPFGTTTRVTREVNPALTTPEKAYWEQTGLVVPLDLAQPVPGNLMNWNIGLGTNYEPMARLNVIGSGAPGARPDLGIVSAFAAKAFLSQAAADWRLARLFTLGSPIHGASVFLDESTGRIPPMNNGSPTGAGGNGAGGSYVGLGAPNNQIQWPQNYTGGLASPEGKPSAFGNFQSGAWTGLDHMPEFNGITYMMFGNRQWLDIMQWRGDGDFIQQAVGPGADLGQAYFRDNNARFTDGNTYHYWGLMLNCFDTRGCAWLQRDITSPATFGADDYPLAPTFAGNPERSLFHDMIKESGNYWPLYLNYVDGPGSVAVTGSFHAPNNQVYAPYDETFKRVYQQSVDHILTTFLHEPIGSYWDLTEQKYWEGFLGGQAYGMPSSYYAITYTLEDMVHDGDLNFPNPGYGATGPVGPQTNGVDGTDIGDYTSVFTNVLSGGQLQYTGGNPAMQLAVGDSLKFIPGWSTPGTTKVDQLPGNRWFSFIGPIDNNARTFYLQCTSADHTAFPTQCPTAGQAFTGFTSGGAPLANTMIISPKYRFQYDPGPGQGYVNDHYASYSAQSISSLSTLGYPVSHAITDMNIREGGTFWGSEPQFNWDPTVTIPGIPAVVTYGNQWPTLSCGYTGTVSSLGLAHGNGNAPGAWTIVKASDPTHYAISGNNLVTVGSLPCNASQMIQVQATQSGATYPTIGEIHLHVNP